MNFKATVKGIAALGGIRPGSHITACPVTATKAGPVAHPWQGTLTITGSNVRLGTEMPVALSLSQ